MARKIVCAPYERVCKEMENSPLNTFFIICFCCKMKYELDIRKGSSARLDWVDEITSFGV